MAYKAIIAGASGLIGSNLLQTLLSHPDYDEVVVLVRKELPVKHKKLVQLVVDFNQLEKYSASITGHAVFSCLGTIRKKTPDLKDYRKIDHDYPLHLANMAKQNGVDQFHLISAIGADSTAGNFYLKIKGDTEDSIKAVGLEILHIYQPSLLVGDRGGDKSRAMEGFFTVMFKILNPLLVGGLKRYRSIKAEQVAHAMFKLSLDNKTGVFVHTTDKIQEIK